MIYHLLLHDGIDSDAVLFQLCLDHLNVVLDILAVPFADIKDSLVVGGHGRHAAVGTGSTCHHSAKRGAVTMVFISHLAVEVVTHPVHDGHDLGSKNVFAICHFLFCCFLLCLALC